MTLRCIKCGVYENSSNFDRKSCRVHNNNHGTCTKCDEVGNCYHEWVYFFLFWRTIRLLKDLFQNNINNQEYVHL